MISGVPTKPVLIRKPDDRTRSARRSPAWWRWSSVGSRAHASAKAYTVGQSLSTRPPGVTNSRAKASRTSPARRAYFSATSASPTTAAARPTTSAERAR